MDSCTRPGIVTAFWPAIHAIRSFDFRLQRTKWLSYFASRRCRIKGFATIHLSSSLIACSPSTTYAGWIPPQATIISTNFSFAFGRNVQRLFICWTILFISACFISIIEFATNLTSKPTIITRHLMLHAKPPLHHRVICVDLSCTPWSCSRAGGVVGSTLGILFAICYERKHTFFAETEMAFFGCRNRNGTFLHDFCSGCSQQ